MTHVVDRLHATAHGRLLDRVLTVMTTIADRGRVEWMSGTGMIGGSVVSPEAGMIGTSEEVMVVVVVEGRRRRHWTLVRSECEFH